jgi:2-polyprenyl-3-methyl-5-hydroxy-6-metoxy-1,4-benzoquinol methylase
MVSYALSPYVNFIESHLIPNASQYGVVHRLTGEVCEPGERVRSLLFAAKLGNRVSFSSEDLDNLAEDGRQIRELIEQEFLVPEGYDALSSFLDQYAVRPLQNPAIAYRSETGEVRLVRVSMAERVYSPKRDDLSAVIEEEMPPLAAEVFLEADGTKTLAEIFVTIHKEDGESVLEQAAFRTAIEFLTRQERQLIKFTRRTDDLNDPFKPFNTVPRNFYHSSRWPAQTTEQDSKSILDFHREGISDASWEFDVIEPTLNHAFRFPNEALGGLNYGSRFCLATLKPEVVPLLSHSSPLEILEVGGGTGTFARSFIEQALQLSATSLNGARPNYHIMDLSPALIECQRRMLSELQPAIEHFEQDATQFDLPGHSFDLIIANEVIADFPIAAVRRNSHDETRENGPEWLGAGAQYVEKYQLSVESAPDSFLVNAGVFQFIERAWKHLSPGGALVLSEYGNVSRYPVESFHLNHAEFSIHFGHVMECARAIGFQCQLQTLKEFLGIDDRVSELSGREEHLQCLNHVLKKHGMSLPFALISENDFEARFRELADRIELAGVSFKPLLNRFHYGPNVDDFMVLIMSKPWE